MTLPRAKGDYCSIVHAFVPLKCVLSDTLRRKDIGRMSLSNIFTKPWKESHQKLVEVNN